MSTETEEMFGEIETLGEFLDRGGDLLAEFGLEKTEEWAKVIAVPFVAGFTGDRSRIALHVLSEFDKAVEPYADLPDDAKPFTRERRDKLQSLLWIAHGCNDDEVASRFVQALPDVIRAECMERAAELLAEHPDGALPPQTASLDLEEIAEKGADEAEAWAALVALDNAGNPSRRELVPELRVVESAYPGTLKTALAIAQGAAQDLDLAENLRHVYKSNVWKPERAIELLAAMVEDD